MICQIDQSGKIEDTQKLTIVAYANKKAKSLIIKATEKRKLIKIMREKDFPKKTFIYKSFSGLVFLLIKNENILQIVIDKEYPGNEPVIKQILLQLFDKANLKKPKIDFEFIGKKSPAHKIAIQTYRGERKPDIIIKAEDVLNLFYKKEKGWRASSKRR